MTILPASLRTGVGFRAVPLFLQGLAFSLALGGAVACDKGQDSTQAPAAKSEVPAASTPAQAPAQPDPGASFAWSAPAKAHVIERIFKDGKWAKTQYDLDVVPSGDELTLSYSNFSFVELEGYDLSKPSIRKQLGRLEAMSRVMVPDFRVNKAGSLTALVDYKGMVDNLAKQAKKLRISPAELASLRSDDAQAGAQAGAQETWTAWVGAWLGVPLKPNNVVDMKTPKKIGDQEIQATQHFEHAGDAAAGERMVWKESYDNAGARVYGGDVVRMLVSQHVQENAVAEKGKKKSKDIDEAALNDALGRATASMSFEYEFTGCSAKVIPHSVSYRKIVTVKIDEQDRQWREDHEWAFAWQDAAAAPPATPPAEPTQPAAVSSN